MYNKLDTKPTLCEKMCSNLVEVFSKRTSNMGEVFIILELNIRRRLVFTCMFYLRFVDKM